MDGVRRKVMNACGRHCCSYYLFLFDTGMTSAAHQFSPCTFICHRYHDCHYHFHCTGAIGFAQGASAAKYFGDKNDYPEVVTPGAAVKDESAFGSTEVNLKTNLEML